MEEDAAELLKGKDSHRVWGRDYTEPTMLLSFLFFLFYSGSIFQATKYFSGSPDWSKLQRGVP
jgi:hypothetical protein